MPPRAKPSAPLSPPRLVLGIEGGATRTSVLVADLEGREIVQFSESAANQRLMTDRELADLFQTIAGKVAGTVLQPAAMCIGLAGTRTDAHRDRILRLAARTWPGVPCMATNDLETALAAGPAKKNTAARVLVLSGTGSCCFGRAADGRTARSGGRGHILGDRGSATDIGQRGLRELMAAYDHTGRWPSLGAAVLDTLALNEPEDLDAWAIGAGKKEIASVAVAVFRAAAKGDRLAGKILRDAAGDLVLDGLTCARLLTKRDERVQFIFNGSTLLKNPAFAAMVKQGLRAEFPRAVITPLARSSVWGAVELARCLALIPFPPGRRARAGADIP